MRSIGSRADGSSIATWMSFRTMFRAAVPTTPEPKALWFPRTSRSSEAFFLLSAAAMRALGRPASQRQTRPKSSAPSASAPRSSSGGMVLPAAYASWAIWGPRSPSFPYALNSGRNVSLIASTASKLSTSNSSAIRRAGSVSGPPLRTTKKVVVVAVAVVPLLLLLAVVVPGA